METVNKWKNLLNSKSGNFDLSNMVNKITNITDGTKKIFNRTKVKKERRRYSAPRWNNNLEMNRNRLRALRRKYQNERDENRRNEIKLLFKKDSAKYKNLIIKTKRDSFKNFLNMATQSGTF